MTCRGQFPIHALQDGEDREAVHARRTTLQFLREWRSNTVRYDKIFRLGDRYSSLQLDDPRIGAGDRSWRGSARVWAARLRSLVGPFP